MSRELNHPSREITPSLTFHRLSQEYRESQVHLLHLLQGLFLADVTDELSKRFRKKEFLDDPAAVWRQLELDQKHQ